MRLELTHRLSAALSTEGVRWYHVETELYDKTLKERTYLVGWYPHSGGRLYLCLRHPALLDLLLVVGLLEAEMVHCSEAD